MSADTKITKQEKRNYVDTPANYSIEFKTPSMRQLIANGLHRTGALRIADRISRKYELHLAPGARWPLLRGAAHPKFLILCYHRIGFGGVPLYSEMSPALFEAHMRFLKKRYRLVSLEEVYKGLTGSSNAESGVAVTFDDGYADLYRFAFPVLRKHGIPATVFLTADAVDTGEVSWYDRIFLALQLIPNGKFEFKVDVDLRFNLDSRASRVRAASEIISRLRRVPNACRKEYCNRLEKGLDFPADELRDRMLNWEQVRAMQDAGVTFGSHTVTHPVISRLSANEMEYEFLDSKQRLQSGLGTPVEDFAFPFGHFEDCGAEAAPLLRQHGYRSAVTTTVGVNSPGADVFALKRVQIDQGDTLPLFALTLSQHFLVPLEEEPHDKLNTGEKSAASLAAERSPYA